eukprot:856798-Amorphochlora_amoeboformis.AAC.1
MEGNSKSPENSPKENSLESKKPPNPVSKPPDGLSTNPSLQHSETDTDRFEGSSLSLQDVSARTLPTETTKTNRFDGEMDNHKENIAVEAVSFNFFLHTTPALTAFPAPIPFP